MHSVIAFNKGLKMENKSEGTLNCTSSLNMTTRSLNTRSISKWKPCIHREREESFHTHEEDMSDLYLGTCGTDGGVQLSNHFSVVTLCPRVG